MYPEDIKAAALAPSVTAWRGPVSGVCVPTPDIIVKIHIDYRHINM
jgi:hypothetical protein